MNNDRTNFNTVSEHEIFGDRDLPSWLTQQQISLACTTYQTSRLMLIGAAPETNWISAFWRIFDRAMGLLGTPSRLYLSSKYQLWQLDNVLESGNLYQEYDKLYIQESVILQEISTFTISQSIKTIKSFLLALCLIVSLQWAIATVANLSGNQVLSHNI
jgi:uncharacterized protein (TIGR03032 family)